MFKASEVNVLGRGEGRDEVAFGDTTCPYNR